MSYITTNTYDAQTDDLTRSCIIAIVGIAIAISTL